MEDFPVLIPRKVKDVNSDAHPDSVEEISNGEMEKSDETPIMQQEPEENIEEIEAPLAPKETSESEVEKQEESKVKKTSEPVNKEPNELEMKKQEESKVKKTSEPEDMNKIEEAPIKNTPQKPMPPKEIPIVCEVNEIDNLEKSQKNVGSEEIVVEVEVMHRNDSQEVRGALPSPKVADSIDEFILYTLDDGKKITYSDSDFNEFIWLQKNHQNIQIQELQILQVTLMNL